MTSDARTAPVTPGRGLRRQGGCSTHPPAERPHHPLARATSAPPFGDATAGRPVSARPGPPARHHPPPRHPRGHAIVAPALVEPPSQRLATTSADAAPEPDPCASPWPTPPNGRDSADALIQEEQGHLLDVGGTTSDRAVDIAEGASRHRQEEQ